MDNRYLIRCGLDQARRARLPKTAILNCQPWETLERLIGGEVPNRI
jgi:hypothetical protein